MTNIRKELENISEDNYAAFLSKIVPTKYPILGVRAPKISAMAKRLIKGDWREFLSNEQAESLEQLALIGSVIAGADMPLSERLDLTKDFVQKIDNWATCDSFCTQYKDAKKFPGEVTEFLRRYEASENEFELRFLIVMHLCHYINEEYIDQTLNLCRAQTLDAYYVKMAVAWTVAECFIKFREKALPLLEGYALPTWTHNKAIQKICESYRIDDQTKQYLKTLKKRL